MKTLMATLIAGMAMTATAQEPAVTSATEYEQLIRQQVQQLLAEQSDAMKKESESHRMASQAAFYQELADRFPHLAVKAKKGNHTPSLASE